MLLAFTAAEHFTVLPYNVFVWQMQKANVDCLKQSSREMLATQKIRTSLDAQRSTYPIYYDMHLI